MRLGPPVKGPDDAPEALRVLAVLWRIISSAPFPVQIEMQNEAHCPTGKKVGWPEPLCIPEPPYIIEAQFAAPAASVNDPDVNDAPTRSTTTMPAATAIKSRQIAVSLDLPFVMKRGGQTESTLCRPSRAADFRPAPRVSGYSRRAATAREGYSERSRGSLTRARARRP